MVDKVVTSSDGVVRWMQVLEAALKPRLISDVRAARATNHDCSLLPVLPNLSRLLIGIRQKSRSFPVFCSV